MNKEDIKKALGYCSNTQCPRSEKCPYNAEFDCADILCKDALNLITEQEKKIENLNGIIDYADKEIKRLKAELEEERDERWNAQDDLVCYCSEEPDKIKQAKIDVLNELKEKSEIFITGLGNGIYKEKSYIAVEIIDELIKEIENGVTVLMRRNETNRGEK